MCLNQRLVEPSGIPERNHQVPSCIMTMRGAALSQFRPEDRLGRAG
jgi:hypothetical protein